MPAAAQRKRSVRADGSPLAGLPRSVQRPLLWQLLHSYLGFNVLKLAILQPPQDVSRGVPADPEVQRVKGREELPPDLPSESTVRVSAASCCGRKTQQRAATPLGTESSCQTRSETSLPQWGRLEDKASRGAQGMELLTCERSVETLSSGSAHPRWRAQCTRAGDAVSLTRRHPLLNQRASPAAPGSLLSGTSYCCSSCTMESPTKSTSGSLSLQSRTKRLCCSEESGQVSCRPPLPGQLPSSTLAATPSSTLLCVNPRAAGHSSWLQGLATTSVPTGAAARLLCTRHMREPRAWQTPSDPSARETTAPQAPDDEDSASCAPAPPHL